MENKPIIICVGRQLGSGGREIARRLAAEFDAKFYDRELLNLAAKESGFSEKMFERNDERKGFFKALFGVQTFHLSGGLYRSDISQDSLFQFQSDAIRKASQEGNCVFVGRCADYVLRDMPNVVNIFVTADIDWRAQHVMKRHECSKEEAQKIIHHEESKRSSYYNYYTGKKWGAAESYDLCIDSSILGIEETGKFIADFIRKCF